jgi:hypothetical protein
VIDQVLFRGVTTPLDAIAIGASRIAGPPDLPEGVAWPSVKERRLPMVLQLALADVAAFPAAARLPRDGTLWFFAAQLDDDWSGAEINEVPSAILYAPASTRLVRATMPPESGDEAYWDRFDVARVEGWRAHRAASEEDEPREDDVHVLFPTRKDSSAYGLVPPVGFVGVLEMRSDYGIGMNWGDAAWATWVVPEADLAAARFDRATANVWIG